MLLYPSSQPLREMQKQRQVARQGADDMDGAGLTSRRTALKALCAAAAVSAITMRLGTAAAAASDYMQPGANRLRTLTQQLASLPRHRDYKALPMILTQPDQWDSEVLDVVLAYDGPRQ